jgi:hypothetical protein
MALTEPFTDRSTLPNRMGNAQSRKPRETGLSGSENLVCTNSPKCAAAVGNAGQYAVAAEYN